MADDGERCRYGSTPLLVDVGIGGSDRDRVMRRSKAIDHCSAYLDLDTRPVSWNKLLNPSCLPDDTALG
jgi:hypothetical protein